MEGGGRPAAAAVGCTAAAHRGGAECAGSSCGVEGGLEVRKKRGEAGWKMKGKAVVSGSMVVTCGWYMLYNYC